MSVEQPAAPARNPVAVVGLVVAIVAVLLRVVVSGVGVFLPVLAQRSGSSISQVALVFTAIGLVLLVLHLTAAVLGLVGLLLPQRRRPTAAAALGIGAAGSLAALADLLVPPLVGAML